MTWKIEKNAWSETDERNYSAFVQALGESGCNSVDSCLQSHANPYHPSDQMNFTLQADCGRFPYLLRAYFAWKNGLPFSWAAEVVSADGAANGTDGDLRYSPNGNLIVRRRDVMQTNSNIIASMLDDVFTAMFRFDPANDFKNGEFYDFYPVHIDRRAVRPGTVIYDPNGHVAVVYKIEDDGRILYFDAHPDDSVSHGTYGEKFMRARPGMGAGFKNFRPVFLVGGKIQTLTYSQIAGYSLEQFYGTNPSPTQAWQKGLFEINGQVLGYYDFVRTRMALGDLKYHPIDELRNGMQALCGDLQDRVTAVNRAINSGIEREEHPGNLPENIYGSSGDWESYSSPSRDARLKTSFRELLTQTQNFVALYKQHSPRVIYTGHNLAGDLRAVYEHESEACTIEYQRSDSSKIKLTYDEIARRLFELSFDPYHCPELRWGAPAGSPELATCPDDASKQSWFGAEQWLRNQLDRTYDTPMGFDLAQLEQHVAGSGVQTAPDTDLKKYLDGLKIE